MQMKRNEKGDDAYSRAQFLLGDLPPPRENHAPHFCEASWGRKRTTSSGMSRASFIASAVECLVDLHAELSADTKNWGVSDSEKARAFKKCLKQTRQTAILLGSHLDRNLRFRLDLSEPEFATELLWLQSIFWDGNFAHLLYLYDELRDEKP